MPKRTPWWLVGLCALSMHCSTRTHDVEAGEADAGYDAAFFDVPASPRASDAAGAGPNAAEGDAAASAGDSGRRDAATAGGADAGSGTGGDAATAFDASTLADADVPSEGAPPRDVWDASGFDAQSVMESGAASEDDDAGGEAPDAGPPRIDCQGKPGAPGDSVRSYRGRNYIVHIPESVYPNTAVPVVFLVHGAGGTGEQMQVGSAFDLIADQDGVVAIYPDGGEGNPWNVGRGACAPGGFVTNNNDDFAYFEAMLDDVAQDQCINREQVFVTGFSMGGYFSHHIGCQRGGDFVRAVAPHSGGTYAGDCPGAPLPVLILHGDADPLIGFGCAQTARDRWVERNGCAEDFDVIDIVGGHCEWHRACPENGQVVLCVFNDLEHSWGYPPDYEFSSALIWAFFRAYL